MDRPIREPYPMSDTQHALVAIVAVLIHELAGKKLLNSESFFRKLEVLAANAKQTQSHPEDATALDVATKALRGKKLAQIYFLVRKINLCH